MPQRVYFLVIYFIVCASIAYTQSEDELLNMDPALIAEMSPSQIADIQQKLKANRGTSSPKRTSVSKQTTGGVSKEIKYLHEYQQAPSNNSQWVLQDTTPKVVSKRYSTRVFQLEKSELFAGASNQVNPNYPLKNGDKLILSIWGGPDAEYQLTIDRSGNIILPDVGRVSLNGYTLSRAEALIKRKLSNSLPGINLGVTNISLRVQELSPLKVYVLGNAVRPSAYVLGGNSSLLSALYMAGGPSEIGSVRQIKIHRGRQQYTVDLYDYLMRGQLPKRHLLRDGDIIQIPAAQKLVEIEGAINRSGIYELKDTEGLKELMEFAQGMSANSNFKVKHRTRNEAGDLYQVDIEDVKAISDIEIKNGDHFAISANKQKVLNTVKITGNIYNPGNYEVKDSTTLQNIIQIASGLSQYANTEGITIFRKNKDKTYSIVKQGYTEPDFKLQALDSVHIPSLNELILKNTISVAGEIKKSKNYPFSEGMTVKSLFLSAGGATQNWDEGKFIVQRVVDRKSPLEVFSYEFDVENMLDSIAKINLKAGDRLFLPSDPFAYRPELITIMGSGVYNPGQYPVNQSGETLLDFINRVILVSDRVQWSGARFYRVKSGSKYPISLDFEKVLNQGPGSTIQLKSGDIIDIPEKEFTVNVQGEVISKGHVLWNKNFDYEDYITYAGGYTRFGDEDRVLIILANGTRVKADDYNGSITPGSQIIVNFKPEDEPINWGAIFTGTVSALGSVAAVVLTIVLINNQVSN